MKTCARLKRDKFWCRILGHKWHYTRDEEAEFIGVVLFVCLRCAGTKLMSGGPPILIPNPDFEVSSELPAAWIEAYKGGENDNKKT